MKLLFAIVQDEDAQKVMNELNKNSFMVTKLSSTGGFLKSGNTTLLVGVQDDYLDKVLEIIENKSKSRKQMINSNTSTSSSMGGIIMPMPLEVKVGGATVFIVNVEDYRKY